MTTFPLKLQHMDEPVAPPAAWLIPGADPLAWIEELAAWGVPMDGLRLFVLPRSLADNNPLGLLVTGMDAPAAIHARRAQPYQVLTGRLYIPADAQLAPSVADAELKTLLIWELQVLHPSAGLIGCRQEEGLSVSDLLEPTARVEMDWDCAARPTAYAPRLLAVEAEVPPTMRSILEEGRDGIGAEPLEEMPPDPDDSELARARLARLRRPGIRFIQWLTGSGGATEGANGGRGSSAAAGGGWTQKLADWAARQMQKVDQTLQDARLRELQRLQKLFESDPDEALKFALPFRDGSTGRGVAPPGRTLPSRDPHFNLGRLSGGRPADSWSVPPDTQRDLIARYRTAANRELNLRRFRRAAYIFGELLGDFSAAANALQQGRFYREAATLYRERLNNLPAAAQCLKDGGLLLEAVVIYEELGQFETAGSIYASVDRQEDSVRCYREALRRLKERDAVLEAATLLETRLHEPEEALDLLLKQWPGSSNAAACLTAYFNLLERLNQHDRTSRQITDLRDGALRGDRVQPLAEVLATVAGKHPSPDVRLLAADATRVVVGRRLPIVSREEAKPLVALVTRLRPGDRLLRRDGSRFLDREIKTYQVAHKTTKPRLVCEFRLSAGLVLSNAVSTGDTFFAIGRQRRERTVVFRARWDGKIQGVVCDDRLGQSSTLAADNAARLLLLIPIGSENPPSIFDSFTPSDGFGESCRFGIPSWLPRSFIVDAGMDPSGVLWVAYSDGGPIATVHAFNAVSGELLRTEPPIELESTIDGQFAAAPTFLVARAGDPFLITGRTVVRLARPVAARQLVMPQRAVRAVRAVGHGYVAAAVAFEEGAVLLLDPGGYVPFAHGMSGPQLGFTRGGALLAATGREAAVYRIDKESITRRCDFTTAMATPLAICPTSKMNEIAFIGSDGLVQVYELPDPR